MLFPGGMEASANGALILSAAAAVLYLIIVNQRPTPLSTPTAVKAMAPNHNTLDCPCGRMIQAASNGPMEEPILPPTWRRLCAMP